MMMELSCDLHIFSVMRKGCYPIPNSRLWSRVTIHLVIYAFKKRAFSFVDLNKVSGNSVSDVELGMKLAHFFASCQEEHCSEVKLHPFLTVLGTANKGAS